jgi:hypothetical protein
MLRERSPTPEPPGRVGYPARGRQKSRRGRGYALMLRERSPTPEPPGRGGLRGCRSHPGYGLAAAVWEGGHWFGVWSRHPRSDPFPPRRQFQLQLGGAIRVGA